MRVRPFDGFEFEAGEVVWDDLYFDETLPLAQQVDDLRDDLLFVRYPNDVAIVVGWLPEFNPEGTYVISVYRDAAMHAPAHTEECRDARQLVDALRRTLVLARQGKSDKDRWKC